LNRRNTVIIARSTTVERQFTAVLKQQCDKGSPSGLMTRAQAGAVVAMKELVER
jgi:hypothetical protein